MGRTRKRRWGRENLGRKWRRDKIQREADRVEEEKKEKKKTSEGGETAGRKKWRNKEYARFCRDTDIGMWEGVWRSELLTPVVKPSVFSQTPSRGWWMRRATWSLAGAPWQVWPWIEQVNPSMYLRRDSDDGFGCGMGPALTVSTGVKMGIRVPLLRRHHPQRVRLLWSTRFGVGSTK